MGRMATKKKFKKTSRAGAAAFAIGLYLAGPQAAIAAAEGSEGAAPDSASAAESAGCVQHSGVRVGADLSPRRVVAE